MGSGVCRAGADVAINWLDDEAAAQRVAGEVRARGKAELAELARSIWFATG